MNNFELLGGSYGVLAIDGPVWRDHKRFALHVFRDFGVGKNLMQQRVSVLTQEIISKKLGSLNVNLYYRRRII